MNVSDLLDVRSLESHQIFFIIAFVREVLVCPLFSLPNHVSSTT